MVDDLTPLPTRVAGDTISSFPVAQALCEKSCHAKAMSRDGFISLLEPRQGLDVTLWNDEHVDGRLGVEILESEHLVVVVFDLGRAFSGNDAAEDAVRSHATLGVVYTSGVERKGIDQSL